MLTLLYHNILREPADHLPVAEGQVILETFRRHVYRFRKDLLHPLEVHDQLVKGKTPRGILVSFDDGAAGIIEAGRVLAEMGAAGVAFVCPGALSSGLWFYRLADALARATASRLRWSKFDLPLAGSLDRRQAYAMLSRDLFDLSAAAREDSLAEIIAALRLPEGKPDPALTTLDNTTIAQAAETRGLVFANHSWSHPNLVKLSSSELKGEIEDAQSWLESSGLPVLPWFAYPRGYHDERVRQVVSQVCPIAFGASAYDQEALALPRTYICQFDANRMRFFAKTAWEGRLRQHLFRGKQRGSLMTASQQS